MKTLAGLSLFTLAPAVALTMAPARANAQQLEPTPEELAVAEPYPTFDPYDTAADPSQIDWPQDVAGEEPAVDYYDDGYEPQAYAEFQDTLAPYGNWINDPTYGNVWAPSASLVGTDFTPYYTGGHWVLTEFGWTWVSDWSWGWAPFHYGRWIIVANYGWCWVPGTIWGPAWVAWRAGDGYVGWAALPPRGVSITATYGYRSPWRFSRAADLGAPRPRCLPMRNTRGMFHRTTMVTNDRVLTRGHTSVHINAGPRHIPGALPSKLTTVAPHAFPQRAILPQRGASMSARPWIRAANGTGGIRGGGGGRAFGSPAGANAGYVFGRTSPGRPLSSAPSSFPNTAPRLYENPRPVAGSPRIYNPPAASTARIYNPPPANPAPRFPAQPPAYGAPRSFGTAPRMQVYNPHLPHVPQAPAGPPRTFPTFPTFPTSPAVNPPRAFPSAPAPSFQPSFQPSFRPAPPAMHAPPPSRAFSGPPTPPPSRSFGTPASSGGFGRAGAQLGGHRR